MVLQRAAWCVPACLVVGLLVIGSGRMDGQQAKLDVLHIGASSSLTGAVNKEKEQASLDTLKAFIKDETRLDNEIQRQKDWRELTRLLTQGKLQLGVYQGYEFAWAQTDRPKLKPLALAVNIYTYPVVYVVAKKSNPATNLAGLKGQSIAIPATGEGILKLFVQREVQKLGQKMKTFFAKIATPDNVEDPIDDVVDGTNQAAVVDQAALEAYKRRKPGRFSQLKPVAQSRPFPPPVVAYCENQLDPETLQRFKQGLLDASQKERGQTMLTLFHLTKFEAVPANFERVLAATRQAYPPPPPKTK